jgi:hypothetical protein
MSEGENNILDNPNEIVPKKWYEQNGIVYAPFALVGLGIVFKIMHWPGASLMILLGFLFSVIRSVVVFLQRSRYLYEWLNLLGNLAGIAFLLMRFFNWYKGTLNIVLVAVFIGGYCAQYFEWPRGLANDQANEIDEEDY